MKYLFPILLYVSCISIGLGLIEIQPTIDSICKFHTHEIYTTGDILTVQKIGRSFSLHSEYIGTIDSVMSLREALHLQSELSPLLKNEKYSWQQVEQIYFHHINNNLKPL